MEGKDSITLKMSTTLVDNLDYHGLYATDTS